MTCYCCLVLIGFSAPVRLKNLWFKVAVTFVSLQAIMLFDFLNLICYCNTLLTNKNIRLLTLALIVGTCKALILPQIDLDRRLNFESNLELNQLPYNFIQLLLAKIAYCSKICKCWPTNLCCHNIYCYAYGNCCFDLVLI